MSIDWFTFVSQIVNFLVLVWLLKWLLYRPITSIMDERKDEVRQRIRDAEERKKEAEQQKEEYEQRLNELEQKREQRIETVRTEVEETKARLMEDVREEVEERRRNWRKQLEDEQKQFMTSFRNRTGELLCRAMRRLLNDLADEELNERTVRTFVEKLRGSDLLNSLPEAEETPRSTPVVYSAFDLSDEMKNRIREVVENSWSSDVSLRFERNPELVCGIEMELGERSVSWNVRDELQRLEEEIQSYLEDRLPGPEEETAERDRAS